MGFARRILGWDEINGNKVFVLCVIFGQERGGMCRGRLQSLIGGFARKVFLTGFTRFTCLGKAIRRCDAFVMGLAQEGLEAGHMPGTG